MNEFEWRRQLRDLRQPVMPQRDLWATIDATLDGTGTVGVLPMPRAKEPTPAHRLRWLAAASVLLLAGVIGWGISPPAAIPSVADTTSAPASESPFTPRSTDPRLSGATIELNSARLELQQAIEQTPNSPSLRRLLSLTEQQQSKWRQLAHEAG